MTDVLIDNLIKPSDRIANGADGLRLGDEGNAIRLVLLHGDHFRYVRKWEKFIVYRAGKWVIDGNEVLMSDLARDVSRTMFQDIETYRTTGILDYDQNGNVVVLGDSDDAPPLYRPWTDAERDAWWTGARSAERRSNIANMIALALPLSLIEHTDLDRDPFILNVLNGSVDLRTGNLERWSEADYCTIQSPIWYNPLVTSALWEECLETWQPDAEIRDYLQLEAGAAFTGHPTETLSIHYGSGGNGKSKYFGALQYVLADYAVVPDRSLVLQTKYEPHPTVMAALCGKRLAVLPETGTQSKLNAEQVKNLTGGDRRTGRRMREDPWEYSPTDTLVMFCNHMPTIQDTSDGIWRRVRVIPWAVTIPPDKIDENLAEKLRAEAQGILTWAVEGAVRFVAGGCKLPMPHKVAVSTADYKQHENVAARFVADCLNIKRSGRARIDLLKAKLTSYCADNGLDEPRWTEVTEVLSRCGGETKVFHGSRCWVGFEFADSTDDDATDLASRGI
ncbi:MAG: phage/plasmid primase, P4 family [Acidimicrobiales bacterium]|jgi:putative DNA primase/helicase